MQRATRTPDAGVMRAVKEAYERGQILEALRQAEAFAPLEQWGDSGPCVWAARLAANAGAPRLSTRLAIRARRTAPTDPEALNQYAYEVLSRRGPLALWEWLRTPGNGDGQPPTEARADMLALMGMAAGDLRDFATAEKLITRAESLAPARAWIRLQRARLLERLDRPEEALDVANAARGLHPHPFYRPAVQMSAHLLQLLDRDAEAVELLAAAGAVLQSGPVAAQLYALLSENGRWAEAEPVLDRYVALSPLLEPPLQRWVTAQRAKAAYHSGRRTDAARFASELDDEFHRAFAQRVSAPAVDRERVQLDVTFVRQHFKTCAPATLAALGRYWRLPAEHVKLAEAMTYDGTPHWQQRRWAEENGWFVREFRITHESAVALLERGIPFAISAVEANSAHMMAVIGFDRAQGTLLLRDPGQPYVIETPAEPFLTRYRAFGPRGAVFLPEQERARLGDAVLPDAAVYDGFHRLWLALSRYDRAGAATVLGGMESAFGDHALVWEGRLELATYDANTAEEMRCLDRLLELFPHNAARLLRRAACLNGAPREERIRFLEQACAAKDADPLLALELARALKGDARFVPQARRWLQRAFRARPMDASVISVKADLCWEEGRLDEATELYRFAANLEGFHEAFYQTWFMACLRTRRADEGLAHLEDRFTRFGPRSAQPALTLAWAWREREQPARARKVLAAARRLRPDDGHLLLRSASLLASLADSEVGRLLAAAHGKVRENDWLRTAAEIAEMRLDAAEALRRWREVLRLEPLALDAHGGVARCLERLEGPAAAQDHLKSACAAFPHHYGLRRMRVEWSRGAATEAAARELLELAPSDAWTRRELALALARSNRAEEALHEAEEAVRIEPRNSWSHSVLGRIQSTLDHLSEARAAFHRAVELSVDNSDALHALVGLARTDAERKEELAFIERELIRQVVNGDGLLAYLELARPILDPEALLGSLRAAHAERPDLWHAWSALVSQLGHLGRLDEAHDIARQATEKFPHLPRGWLDLAQVHQWRNEPGEETAAAERAFEINPAWGRSTLALADALERRGKLNDARKVYERALQHAAADPQLHACHAHVLWRQRKKEEAFAAIEQALRLAPGYEWAWAVLSDWVAEAGQPDRIGNFARMLTRERPGEMRVWLMLAHWLRDPAALPERLAALERALELDGASTDAWDLKAELLANAERFEDAIRACEEGAAACAVDGYILRGRRAWVEARRRQFGEAVRLMRALLADNASYVWGWHQLALWLSEQGELADAAAALERLRKLRPHDPWVNRQLGILRQRQDDPAGAQEAFAAALRLAPTDVFAAQSLFELQSQAGDLSGAASTLRVMQTHQPGARTLAMEVLLRLGEKDTATAVKRFRALCLSPDPDPWPVEGATDAFRRAGHARQALRVLKESLRNATCNPQVGASAIRLLIGQRRAFAAVWWFLRLKPGEGQRRSAAPLAQGLGQLRSRFLLRCLLWRRRAALAGDDDAWGQVGYALSHLGRMRAVARWLADWRTRTNAQPWMLFNLCLALRHLGRYEEANAVARHVLEAWGHRERAGELRLFLAVEEALQGSIPNALLHLKLATPRADVAHDQDLVLLAKTLVEFRQSPAADRVGAFEEAGRKLGGRFSVGCLLRAMKDVRRTFRRAGRVFVREGGGWRARLWFGWRLNWQWLLLPLAPVLLGIALQPPVMIGLAIWFLARRQRS